MINTIYATNKYLFNIKIVKHNTCTFCEDVPETIVHLFWQCPITQIFIKEILSRELASATRSFTHRNTYNNTYQNIH